MLNAGNWLIASEVPIIHVNNVVTKRACSLFDCVNCINYDLCIALNFSVQVLQTLLRDEIVARSRIISNQVISEFRYWFHHARDMAYYFESAFWIGWHWSWRWCKLQGEQRSDRIWSPSSIPLRGWSCCSYGRERDSCLWNRSCTSEIYIFYSTIMS